MGFECFVFFVVCWWIVIMVILPIKVKTDSQQHCGGIASSAPSQHYIVFKLIFTTLFTIVLTITYYYLKVNKYIDYEYLYSLL